MLVDSDPNRQFEITTYAFRNQGSRNRVARRLALALAEGETSVIATPKGQHRVSIRRSAPETRGHNMIAACETCNWMGFPRQDQPVDAAGELLTHAESFPPAPPEADQ
jgi:hypothetical protein